MPNVQGRATEAEEQAALFQWASYIPELKYMFAIPNGGSRHPYEARNLKRQGVKSGVPDLCLPLARGGYHSLYIEMKVGRNKPTDNQSEYIDYLNANGFMAVVCYGFDSARRTILQYLSLSK